jgi:hypothetical protein
VATSYIPSTRNHVRRRRPLPGVFPPPSFSSSQSRRYSDDGPPSATAASGKSPEIPLDRFTRTALNSHQMPLGTMNHNQWLDVLDAVDAWLRMGGSGYSVVSAEGLLERLFCELAATRQRDPGAARERAAILLDVHLLVLQSWIETFRELGGNSLLALTRGHRSLRRMLELSPQLGDAGRRRTDFPLDEFIALVRGYLSLRTETGSEGASRLLLEMVGDVDEIQLHRVDHARVIGPLFEECVAQLLAYDVTNDAALDLVDCMNALKQSAAWTEMKIPNVAERMALESSIDRATDPNQSATDIGGQLSSFEQEALQERLIHVLTSANKKEDVESLLLKLSKIQPGDKLIMTLTEFYVRIGDPENASEWLQKLGTSSLVASDLIERIIDSWGAQAGPRIAWRADEVFKTLINRVRTQDEMSTVNSQAFSKIILLWSTTEDPAADRKIVDWFSQMKLLDVQPDTATLKVILDAAIRGGFENYIRIVAQDLRERWDSLGSVEKDGFLESVLGMASQGGCDASTITHFIDCFQFDNTLPRHRLCRAFLNSLDVRSSSASDVMTIIDSLGNPNGETDLSLFSLAIQVLFNVEMKPVAEVESIYDRALCIIQESQSDMDANEIANFIDGVIAMHVHRKLWTEAGSCLQKAEDKLLANAESSNGVSLVPLDSYKRVIVRKWYTSTTAPRAEQTFKRLMALYRSGYSNLRPDWEVYTGYIRALSAGGKDVEGPLNELIDLYQAAGLKPPLLGAEAFNVVLLSYGQQKEKAFKAGNKSTDLLNRMTAIGVDPDVKTLNLVLQNVTKGANPHAYTIVAGLMARLEEYNLQPDSFTLHCILDACGSAPSAEHDTALKKVLLTLREIREGGHVGRTTYGIASRVVYRLLRKGSARADKVAASVMALCIEDGWFDSVIRDRLQSLMSSGAWADHYLTELSDDGQEPARWSRNVPLEISLSKVRAA